MRIDKYLADCGTGTRKEVKEYIKNGRVMCNGLLIKSSSAHINEKEDDILLDGKKLCYNRFVYFMLNKPSGVVSATYDNKFPVVVNLVPKEYSHYNVFPVGRLDIDTTGLLILTNDGALAHRLTSPKHHVDKTYYATIDGFVDKSDVDIFLKGVKIDDGYVCKSAELNIIKSSDVSEIELTIREGKFHQVKRMFEAVGKKVITLKRISMGGVALDDNLLEGDIRLLDENEIATLHSV